MCELWDINCCELIKKVSTIHEAIYEARKRLGNGRWEVRKNQGITYVIERDGEGDLYDGYSIKGE